MKHKILKKYWGYDSFRPLQAEIIDSVLQAHDTLAILPTGGGKSICFQVPAMISEGLCIVVSPLIALMKDQVENLKKINISAVAIYSGMSQMEICQVMDNAIYGKYKFLYLSPERLQTEIFLSRVKNLKINLIAIDEAHCISQWGYDFRPPYLKIAQLRTYFPQVPLIALTATATKIVAKDIIEKLEFKEKRSFYKGSFDRPNIIYGVVNENNKYTKLISILQKIEGSGIVYLRSRKATATIASFLQNYGISADFYHAGLSGEERDEKQEKWKTNKIRIIVATNAFGMGIDKPDVRIVIHLGFPPSLEDYYQEAGRAGRDIKKSYAVAIVNQIDIDQHEKNKRNTFPKIKEIKQVYSSLCNYFQIPFNSGKNKEFNFNLMDFVDKFNLNAIKTLNILKILEQDNYLVLTESIFIPSKVFFKISYQDIYEFEVENKVFEPVIKALLRMYEGLFEVYVGINERELARILQIEEKEIVMLLERLKKLEILDYIPQKDQPRILFLEDRLREENLFINLQKIRKREQIYITKLDSVKKYMFQNHKCRSKNMLSYFDEFNEKDCGHCDYCVKKNKNYNSSLKTEILNHLKYNNLNIRDIKKVFSDFSELQIKKTFRWLVDKNKIEVTKEGKIVLKKG